MLSLTMLSALWPNGDVKIPGLTAQIVATSDAVFAKYNLTSDLTVAHAMAQFSHECGAGTDVVENLNYSAQGLIATWPQRFDQAKAAAFAHRPEKIANEVYNGRMGNQPGSEDGWNFRGRGGSQVTGRAGYQRLGERTGLDLTTTPDLVNDPAHFIECAVADFILCGCLPFALVDDVKNVTLHLNGGETGLDQRIVWLAKWKAALAGTLPQTHDLAWAQTSLNQLGQTPPLAVDGQSGPTTERALADFQQAHGLQADGKFGPATAAAILAAFNG